MKITFEMDLNDFTAWGGGLETLNELKELGKVDELSEYIQNSFTEILAVQLNDFLWFERDDIMYEILGLEEK